MLLLLQRECVQVFVAAHDYFLTKYLSIWDGKLIVLNDKLALEQGLISK